MKLSETSQSGDALYNCDLCRRVGERPFFVIQEKDGLHFCFNCWNERESSRLRIHIKAVIEL